MRSNETTKIHSKVAARAVPVFITIYYKNIKNVRMTIFGVPLL